MKRSEKSIKIDKKIIELYNQDKEISEIAIEVECSKRTVYRRIERLIADGEIIDREIQIEEKIIELYKQDIEIRDIAIKVERCYSNVCKIIRKLKSEGRIKDREEEKDKQIIKYIRNGEHPEDIAKQVNVTRQTVYRKKKKFNNEINVSKINIKETDMKEIKDKIKTLIDRKEYDKCMKFIETVLENKKLNKVDKNILVVYKEFIKREKAVLKAIRLLKKEKDIETIQKLTCLNEYEIIDIKNEYIDNKIDERE